MDRRLVFCGIIATCGLIAVTAHLGYIQFVQGEEYSKRAYNQQMQNQIISPKRGTIYDSNGNVLAQSISVDTISINPSQVTYSNNTKVDPEVLATALSEIFDITYEDALAKAQSQKSVEVIAKKVEQEKVDLLEKWMSDNKVTAGINIDEDTKRYYPNNNLASNLLGFCGDDNTGLSGLEERWNDVLTGTSGKVVTALDTDGNPISDENEEYVPAENGSNIYLTIDTNIQRIAEKYLSQAVTENKCANGGTVIIMNPQTGDILAMASNPDYNLNSPRDGSATSVASSWDTLTSEEKTNALYKLWRNKAVSDLYEPGSTFKLITSSIGLEENLVQTDTANDFNCNIVYYPEPNTAISCWRTYAAHLGQSLRQALQNSCNPAFMQLGARIGAKLSYKYYEAFGLFDQTIGNNIAAVPKSIFTNIDQVGPVELATMSFGQRFSITPLQLITAVSAICNDGVLVQPRIVKQIVNTDTQSTENIEVEEVRQVISKETADKVKDMMLSVVEEGTGKYAKVQGYSIGGKSGTSEPVASKLEEDGYTASFIAISPIENTQVVCLVVLYKPQGDAGHQGGQTAGPVAAQILSEVLPYLGIPSTDSVSEAVTVSSTIAVQNVTNKTVSEAKKILKESGFNVSVNSDIDEDTTLVTEQVPKSGIYLEEGSTIVLYTDTASEKTTVTVPNIKGKTEEEATKILQNSGLNIKVEGSSGIVVSQDPSYDVEVDKGTVVNVVIKEELTDGQ
jgi:stage V sporulation protein D (sporulation-specific penicillin-binding protein)